MDSQTYKALTIETPEWNVPVGINRKKTSDKYGYLILLHYGVTTVFMRTPWSEMTPETVLADIELTTRKGNHLCFATMKHEINKLKTRDLFGLESDWSLEDRQAIFSSWYSPKARSLTNCSQFPLLRGQVSKRFPNGPIKIPGQKCSVDSVLMV